MPTTSLRLGEISSIEIAKRTWTEIREDDVFGRAAQLAYYFFLALFPFLICVIASLSVFGRADRGRALLIALFNRIFPVTAYRLIDQTMVDIIQSGGPLRMSFGIVFSLWSASMGMTAVMDTLNAAYNVKETRPLIKQYAIAIGLTIGLTALVVAALLIIVLGDQLIASFPLENILAFAWKFMKWPLSFAVLLLALAFTYHFAPNLKNRKWHWLSPGSIAGVFLLLIVGFGVRIYVHYSGNFDSVYGSLGAVIVLLICFYLGGVAILSGGALNGLLENLAHAKNADQNEFTWESTTEAQRQK
jgi:membrane protein